MRTVPPVTSFVVAPSLKQVTGRHYVKKELPVVKTDESTEWNPRLALFNRIGTVRSVPISVSAKQY